MKERNIFFLSAGVSLLAHLAILCATFFIWIPGVTGSAMNAATVPQARQIFHVKSIAPEKVSATAGSVQAGRVRKIKFENPAMAAAGKAAAESSFSQAPPQIKAPDILGNVLPEKMSMDTSAPLPQPEAAPEVLKEKIQLATRQVDRNQALGKAEVFVSSTNLTESAGAMELPKEFREQMPAFTPEKFLQGTLTPSNGGADSGVASGIMNGEFGFQPDEQNESLDAFLNVSFLTYRDPADGQGYYQISIYSSPQAKDLEVLPKEIIFLVDASLSIQRRRLNGFREGIKYALQHLNPEDKFNIFVFKNEIIPFAETSVSTRTDSILRAMDFMDRIEPSNRTDIYTAFFQTIQKPAALEPSYIVLLSDGRPSEGESSTGKLISEITRKNDQKRPIFAFSGGARVNRFLLDFLAYPNRGWSEFAPYDSQIQEKFSAFYDKIQNPILANLRYQLTPLDEKQAYPKNLPDFYRDTLFTVYGTFKDETKFSIRILGEEGGNTKEFIFSHDLRQAQQGTSEIAKHWAFNKVYYLISQMTLHGPTPEQKEEIQKLVKKFGLDIPYNVDELI